MKMNKIVAFVALIGSIGVVNGMEFFPSEKPRDPGFFRKANRSCKPYAPVLQAFLIKNSIENLTDSQSDTGKRLRESAARLNIYARHYQLAQQNNSDYAYANDYFNKNESAHFLGITAHQFGYMAVDAATAYGFNRLPQYKIGKTLMQSEPMQYISKNVSEENKKFIKDQAIVVTSTGLIDCFYRNLPSATKENNLVVVSMKSQYKEGFFNTAAKHVVMNSATHFVVKPLVKEYVMDNQIGEEVVSPLVTHGIYTAAPHVLKFVVDSYNKK